MRHKRAKKTVAIGMGESTPEEVSLVPAISWEELLGRAEASLDEKGLEAQERRIRSAEKILRRLKERGIKPKWDLAGVRRALTAYYADCVLGEGRLGFRKVFAQAGVPTADFLDARDAYPEFRMVMEYIKRRSDELAATEAMELSRQAQTAQKRLVTEEGCDLNQRAVELSLKATMKNVYGDDEADKGAEKRKPIVYKFENLSVNMIMSPGELAQKKLDGATPVSEVIDV